MQKKISISPKRHSFHKENYQKRCAEGNDEFDQASIDYFDEIINAHKSRFLTEESRKDSLEYDLLTTDWILEKVRSSEIYAQHLYAAMCNNDFQKIEIDNTPDNLVKVLKDGKKSWSCSWRYAGGIIADMRQEGDYIDWYCSGIRDTNDDSKFVGESFVTDEIKNDLLQLGWRVIVEDPF